MRIGLITPGFSASEGDWCVPALLDLVRMLAEHHEVEVFALRYPHRTASYPVYGAQVHPTGGGQRGGLARLSILWQTWRRLRRRSQHRPFDVLHALWAHEPGTLAVFAGRRLGVPVMVSILGGELADLPEIDYGGARSRANRWLASWALAGADRVTVGSRWLREQVGEQVSDAKLNLQPLGFEIARFQCHRPRSQNRVIRLLQVASPNSVKDHRTLLKAFALVVQVIPGVQLNLVGEGIDGPEMVALVSEQGLEGRVGLHGGVDHAALASHYQQADLLIQSSRFESQGMAVLEAVAGGCPVVGTAVGVLPELSACEAMVPPGDHEALATLIQALLADPERRDRLRASQAEALGRFDLGPTADAWMEQYRRLMSEYAARA